MTKAATRNHPARHEKQKRLVLYGTLPINNLSVVPSYTEPIPRFKVEISVEPHSFLNACLKTPTTVSMA